MKKAAPGSIPLFVILGAVAAWGLGSTPQESLPAVAPEVPEEAVSAQAPARFIEITGGCGPYFVGACVNVRSGPGTEFPSVGKLRDGVVLAVATSTVQSEDGIVWYQIVFDEWLRYPERVEGAWYVASSFARVVDAAGPEELDPLAANPLAQAGALLGHTTTEKRIVVDRSEQMLYAYEGTKLVLETPISTGLDLTPTPRGIFTIYRKTPTRYMQGPLPGISDQYYDLPGVPWNLYFTMEGGAIHGAYWHEEFGQQWSHGCVNLPLAIARTLYEWAPLGTQVLVQD